jgi:hypothetical protein
MPHDDALLAQLAAFSRDVIGLPLRPYQVRPLAAVLRSVREGLGREFLLLFPRQSGKNEAIAQLLVFLLNETQERGGTMVFAAVGDGVGRGRDRVALRLDNEWNRGAWGRRADPSRLTLGAAAVAFLSSYPGAAARGQTAERLLVIDELQDHDPAHVQAVFTPMRAASNATAVYLGTTRTQQDALWLKKTELEMLEGLDGARRVFRVGPEEVIAENPAYGRFLDQQVALYGRFHPIVAAEYFLEPLSGAGGLFPPRRLALLRGAHARRRAPDGAWPVLALIDVGGQDEAATGAAATLDNPGRDYTVCTFVEARQEGGAPEPAFRAVDVFVDQGSRFFEAHPGREALAERLLAALRRWDVAQVIIDATGVGEGLSDWLAARLGAGLLTPFKFTASSKAALGAGFVSLIEAGRFCYWGDDAEEAGSDGWWFLQQAAGCAYALAQGAAFDRGLRWGVPAGARIGTENGRVPLHDDRLLSAALVAEAARLWGAGKLPLGRAESAVILPTDPLAGLRF